MAPDNAARLVEQFENHTLPKEQWTHEAHFIVAFWYCTHYPLPHAVQKITSGIKTYNISLGGLNTDSAGYHETITLFYMATIARYVITNGISDVCNEQVTALLQQPFMARDYILHFYRKEVLQGSRARLNWVEPCYKGLL